jgi:hypothetical protein
MYEAVRAYEAESTLPSKYEAVTANVAYEALLTTIEPVSFDVITLFGVTPVIPRFLQKVKDESKENIQVIKLKRLSEISIII